VVKAGKDGKKQKVDNNIWTVNFVEPAFLILGFASGFVSIYETSFGTLIQEFKEHAADILCITVSRDHNTVYISGADSLIMTLSKDNKNADKINNELEVSNNTYDYEFS